MFNVSFMVKNIDDFVYLIRIGRSERNYFIILSHLVQKILTMWPKNMAF